MKYTNAEGETFEADKITELSMMLHAVSQKKDPDDWIEWKGDVIRPTDKRVSIKFRSGYVSHYQDPRHWSWVHTGKEGDIIAYRLARP